MTLSTTTSRIQYTGNAATTAFAFPYRFLANGDLTVTITTPAGATTTQVLGTDYTVTGAGLDAGGTVTMTTPPASGELLTIRRVLDLTQEVDYQSGDPFPAETHEQALDRLTMITQQLDEALTRTLTLPPESNADASAIDVEAVETVAGIAADVSAVAAVDNEVTTVAGIAANVTTVAGIAASIPAVAAVASDIPAVAAVDSEIVTVAGIAADVSAVAGVSANVTTVATNIASVNTAAANIAAIIDAPTQAAAAAASALAADGSADAAAISETNAAVSAAAAQVRTKIEPVSASVAANALTLTLNPTVLDFRSATLGSGAVNTRTVSSAINLVVSSGSTLGTTNGALSRLAVLAIDNAGTVELAVVNLAGSVNLNEEGVISTTAEGGAGAADSASTIYSTTARTNVPYRIVGFVESTQATAGTWATAPSLVHASSPLAKWLSGYGQRWQTPTRTAGTPYTNSTGRQITVSINSSSTSGNNVFTVDGQTAFSFASGVQAVQTVTIPAGSQYLLTLGAGGALTNWFEQR